MNKAGNRYRISLIIASVTVSSFLGAFATTAKEATSDTILLTDSLTSSGYAQSIAISNVLNPLRLHKIKVLPVPNGTKRAEMLRDQAADFCICNMDSYFAQEGLLQFEAPSLGPQAARLVLSSTSDFRIGLAIAKDSGTAKLADMRQKRFAWIRNADQINALTTAFLAFAGLGWDDVLKITFPGYSEAAIGLQKKQVDALVTSELSSEYKRILNGKRNVYFADFSRENKKSWARMLQVAPYLQPVSSASWNGVTHPYPLLITNSTQSVDKIYQLTKQISENLEDLQKQAPGAEGWHTAWQDLTWVIPYHPGAIKYFTEIGIWTDAAQRYQDNLIARQERLQAAFKQYIQTDIDEKEFSTGWRRARQLALTPPPTDK